MTQLAEIMVAANSVADVVLLFLHVQNRTAIAQVGTKLLTDAATAIVGGPAAEIAAAPTLLRDAAALAEAAMQEPTTTSVTVTKTQG